MAIFTIMIIPFTHCSSRVVIVNDLDIMFGIKMQRLKRYFSHKTGNLDWCVCNYTRILLNEFVLNTFTLQVNKAQRKPSHTARGPAVIDYFKICNWLQIFSLWTTVELRSYISDPAEATDLPGSPWLLRDIQCQGKRRLYSLICVQFPKSDPVITIHVPAYVP